MGCVCIVADHQKGKVKKATRSAMTFGNMVAESLKLDLKILVLGNNVSNIADSLCQFGASEVWVVDDPVLEHYSAETWGHAIAEAAKNGGAELVCMNSGTTARDLMPRVAAKMDAGMATDVIGFDGKLFTREMYAGNAVAEIEVLTDVKVATIQGTVFEAAQPSDKKAVVERLNIAIPQPKARFVDFVETVSERPELTESAVVISGGRGMKDPKNFEMIEALADYFNGAVGATRAAVDAGWLSNDFQVGQTGKKVAPELYIAIGLSGAIQHIAGMKNSKVIVAINKDEEAPIFEVADYGIVGDLFKVVPEFISGLKSFERKV